MNNVIIMKDYYGVMQQKWSDTKLTAQQYLAASFYVLGSNAVGI